ncbi:MAG: photosystem II reaction center PsbP [Synechococcus sp.]
MLRRAIAGILATLIIFVGGCSAKAGLQTYTDRSGLFTFAYPNGMNQVAAAPSNTGQSILFRDLVYGDELVDLTVADYDKADTIDGLGSIPEVGERVANNLLAPEGSGRTATLVNGGSIDRDGQMYYIFEYTLDADGMPRHDMVAVTIKRHKLYTLTASTSERRWNTVKGAFYEVAKSLQVS